MFVDYAGVVSTVHYSARGLTNVLHKFNKIVFL